MRCSKGSRGKAVGLVQQHHDTTYSGCADQCAKELPSFLFLRLCATPVTDFQVGDERTCHRKGSAYDTTHDEGCHHTTRAFQSYAYHHDRGEDESHQRHTANGVGAHNSNGIGCNGGEKEGNDSREDNGYKGKEQIAVHDTKPEEEEGEDKRQRGCNGNELEGQVLLYCALRFCCRTRFRCQSNGTLDNTPRLDDADDTSHSDGSNADALAVGGEDEFRRHVAHSCINSRIPLVQNSIGEKQGHSWYDEPPYEQRAQRNDEGVAKADDVT